MNEHDEIPFEELTEEEQARLVREEKEERKLRRWEMAHEEGRDR